MVFRLEQTLDSLLEQTGLEETVFEEFVWSGHKRRKYSDFHMSVYVRRSWEEFKTRYPEEFDMMLRRYSGYLPEDHPNRRFDSWWREIGWPLEEVIVNAGVHGNKRDPHKKVKITRYYGKKGIVYSIEDEGDGFDIQTTVEKFRKSEKYHSLHGCGLLILNYTKMVVTANNKGNQIILQYLLG